MSVEENKALVRRSIEALNDLDLKALDEIYAPALRPMARQIAEMTEKTWGDHRTEITDMVAEGDAVWVRLATSGGHVGEFAGIPPTGKRWTNTGVLFLRLQDGKIAQADALFDVMNHVKQLGATLTLPVPTAGAIR
ncbi:MAG: ester cyclase [Chloroflexota bacterium]